MLGVVEAMHREFSRQAQGTDIAVVALKPRAPGNASDRTLLSGHFDLQQVARAGLRAIRHPDPFMRRAYDAEVATDGPAAALDPGAFGVLIDAIIGEAP